MEIESILEVYPSQTLEEKQLYLINLSDMKLQTKGNCDESDACSSRPTRSFKLRGNKILQKLRRKIELGWMHNGKHVRSSNGGGSRKIELPRDAKKQTF